MLDLNKLTGLEIYPASVSEADGVTYFIGRRGLEKFVGCIGHGKIQGPQMTMFSGLPVVVGPLDHSNAMAIRKALTWTAPQCLGLATSVGMGDRLGLATPGHLRAVYGTGLMPILAQQSIREMTRTQRSAEEVIDCATWGVLQEGYRGGFGSDADHLQQFEGIDATAAAGFTQFTIDPGQHVNNAADTMDASALKKAMANIDLKTLATSVDELKAEYLKGPISLVGGTKIKFDELSLMRAIIKYGNAIAHTVKMYRHVFEVCKRPFELEVSVDETDSPTTPAEHYFFAAQLKRLDVRWVSMAPRFIGRFEKGVDYIGDLEDFRKSFKSHVAVMKTVGPYKMSIHSGSDKFSIYPIIAELAGDMVHLKTAGTSWLEALRAVAQIDPDLFRAILNFARERYETDKASYHVSADISKVKSADKLADAALPKLIDDFHVRQALHVTFGSVLTADGGERFRKGIYDALKQQEEKHYAVLAKHLGKHVKPFAKN